MYKPRGPEKKYIRCKPSRNFNTSFGPWVLAPKSNTNVIIEHIAYGKPSRVIKIIREDGTIVVRRIKDAK